MPHPNCITERHTTKNLSVELLGALHRLLGQFQQAAALAVACAHHFYQRLGQSITNSQHEKYTLPG